LNLLAKFAQCILYVRIRKRRFWGILGQKWGNNKVAVAQQQTERKKASYPSRTACLGLEVFFVNYRLATARHGFRSAKLLNFTFV
jgi:hypothetical protein